MNETTEDSLKWAIKLVQYELQDALLCRRVYKTLVAKGMGHNNSIKMYERSARKYIQRLKNFKKLMNIIY